MKQIVKEMPVCQNCGSDDVSFDAAARWNVEAQHYELTSTFASGSCSSCDEEFDPVDWNTVNETA